jgi:K+-transporting ATPase KdpF subunit
MHKSGRSGRHTDDSGACEVKTMDIVVGLIGVALLAYLFVSVLRPEWF